LVTTNAYPTVAAGATKRKTVGIEVIYSIDRRERKRVGRTSAVVARVGPAGLSSNCHLLALRTIVRILTRAEVRVMVAGWVNIG